MHAPCVVRAAAIEAAADPERARAHLALDDLTTVVADRVWLATGTAPHIGSLRFLRDLVADLPVIDGIPVLGEDLGLGGHPIHVVGRLAMLTLGPAAGNLWGAQRSARRVVQAVEASVQDVKTA